MTKQTFHQSWVAQYGNTPPLSHVFKETFATRWFRVHSLPGGKRYAANEQEWQILLTRQNQIITHLLATATDVLLVAGNYNDDAASQQLSTADTFAAYHFTQLDTIPLHVLNPHEYDASDTYTPAFAPIIWQPHGHNHLLQAIANDTTRAFFVSFEQQVIIAPYDGGIDCIVKDSLTKQQYQNKYKDWLSNRADLL
jgi:hypothetical protein